MNVFFLALVICAVGTAPAFAQDSPEVAAAKAAHFEAVRRAELVIANAPPVERNENRPPVPETTQHQLGLNVQDTPEVAAAKAAHYEAVRDAEHATAVANATNRHQSGVHIDIHSPSGSYDHHSTPVHHPAPVHHPSHHHSPSPVHHPSPAYHPSHVQHTSPVYRPEHGHYSPPHHHHHYVTDVHYHPGHPYSSPEVQTTQHKLGVAVQDTPEVAAAKAAHYDAVRQAEQAAAASNPDDDGSYLNYSNEPAVPVVPVTSVVAPAQISETPEVAAARAAHFEALRRAQAVAGPQAAPIPAPYFPMIQEVVFMPPVYHPVVAVPQTNQHKLGVNVHDTPEVAAAKAAHYAAFRQAQLVAAENEEFKSEPHSNFYANTARQYGQVHYK